MIRTSFHDPEDSGFGQIDKTDKYMGHNNWRSLYENQWQWDERMGIKKPERTAHYAAANVASAMYNFGLKNGLHGEMLRINDEHYHYKCEVPVASNQEFDSILNLNSKSVRGWLCDEKVAEIWYTNAENAQNCMIRPEEPGVLLERTHQMRDEFVEDKYIFKVN